LIRKITFFAIAMSGLNLSLLIFMHIVFNQEKNDSFLQKKAILEAESINYFISESYIFGDIVSLRRYLDAYANINNWTEATLIDASKHIIWKKIILENKKIYNRSKLYSINIGPQDGDTIGVLTFKKNNTAEEKILKEQEKTSFLILMALSSLGVIIQFLFLTFLLKPIKEVVKELKNEANRMGISLPIVQNKNEIYQIKNWFNTIVEYWYKEKIASAINLKYKVSAEIARQVAHDIQSPIQSLEIALQHIDNAPEDMQDIISKSIYRIKHISDDLFKKSLQNKEKFISKDQGQVSIKIINNLINEIENEYKLKIKNTIFILSSLYSTELDKFVTINQMTLYRIVINIINNAIDSITSSKVQNGKIVISSSIVQHFYFLKIENNGPAIPTHIIDSIWKKNFTHGKNKPSLGLGLYHAKEEIEKIGGKINLETSVKKTEFNILLPLESNDFTNSFVPPN
jgi:signal transduction histidine kinase